MAPSTEPRHPIQVVARRTGLTADTLRAWEKRYDAVAPRRAPGGRRLYSDQDVERLTLLSRAAAAGRRIGQIVPLTTDELRALVDEDEAAARSRPRPSTAGETGHLERCLAAVEALDAPGLERELRRGLFDLSPRDLMEDVLTPLMHEVGSRWERGALDASREHLATAMVRSLLGVQAVAGSPAAGAPAIVVSTPAGQSHEIGALMAAVTAATQGWRVLYLGADLPAAEIARAARDVDASVVALSLIYPVDDPGIGGELETLRRELRDDVVILAGGRGAASYEPALRAAGVRRVESFDAFRDELGAARGPVESAAR